MSFTVTDRTKESSSTTGTGAFTLSGAPSNYVTFNTAVGVNNFTHYAINHLSANEWEVGYGQLTGATTLTRLIVFSGTNGTSFVNFSAGTKEVFVTLPSSFNGQTLGRTNIIINPHGSIQQETTTPVTTSGAYFADQWIASISAATAAFQAGVTTGTVSAYDPSYMFYKTTTAKGSLAVGDNAHIVQFVEGNYIRRLLYGGSSAKMSWLRWRASSSQSGTASVAIRNAAGDRTFVQAFSVTTTPTDYFLFVPGDTTGTWPTTNALGAQVHFTFAAGTALQTSTLGAWQAGNFIAANTQSNMLDTVNRQLNITDVQWSQSAVLLPFEPIDWEQELGRCRRYFKTSYNGNTGNNVGSASAPLVTFIPIRTDFYSPLPVGGPPMRTAAPTTTTYSPATGTANRVRNSDTSTDITASASSDAWGTWVQIVATMTSQQNHNMAYVINARM
ncbi:hypothetical protein D3C87_991900 [compost metagenome]